MREMMKVTYIENGNVIKRKEKLSLQNIEKILKKLIDKSNFYEVTLWNSESEEVITTMGTMKVRKVEIEGLNNTIRLESSPKMHPTIIMKNIKSLEISTKLSKNGLNKKTQYSFSNDSEDNWYCRLTLEFY